MADDDGTGRPLVTLKERADLTGENFETLRSQAQEGKLPGARKDNRGRWLVPLPLGTPREPPGSGPNEVVTELRERLAEARAEMERLRSRVEAEAEAARLAAAKAEEQVAAARAEAEAARIAAARNEERATLLRDSLDRERDRADRLEAELRQELAEARRPWWRRLIGS
jgi:hypothetical protein